MLILSFSIVSILTYPNYKFIFPIKALGMYARRFEGDGRSGDATTTAG